MPATNDRGEGSLHPAEAAARAAIEMRLNPMLTEREWVTMRDRLLEFAGILRNWDRKTTASRRGNLEVLCQPEP